MRSIFILVGIWAVISFIYAKIKGTRFIEAFLGLPLKLLSSIFRHSANDYNLRDAERKAKKQGRDDIVDNIQNARDAYNSFADQMDDFAERIKKD